MQFHNLTKKNRLVLIIFVLFILILSVLAVIFYLDNGNSLNRLLSKNPSFSNQTTLTNYDNLKNEITSLIKKDKTIADIPDYQKMIKLINQLEDKKLSKEEQFNTSLAAAEYLAFAYTQSGNHKLYDLEQTLKDFIRENFPEKNYPNTKPACFDKSCADSPQPQEILDIIEEIKNSSIPEYLKENDIGNLTITGYVDKDKLLLKTNNYLEMAEIIKRSEFYTKAGINLKIYNEINDFVKKTYPKEYED